MEREPGTKSTEHWQGRVPITCSCSPEEKGEPGANGTHACLRFANWSLPQPLAWTIWLICLLQGFILFKYSNPFNSSPLVSQDTCHAYLDTKVSKSISLILTADPGDFSGTSEAHFILANLEHVHAKPEGTSVCGSVSYGQLMGQHIMLATTGIGPSAAALCTHEVLHACGPRISEAIYFGTSGWSPALGGILNPPQCSAPHKTDQITRLGDVCVTPFSVNWACKKTTWAMQAEGYPNQCFRPEEVPTPNPDALFGRCTFNKGNMKANLRLADDLLRAARHASMPQRTIAVAKNEKKYWGLMSEAANMTYSVPEPGTPPSIRDYTQCVEVDGQMFFSGVPWELKARDYAAQTITAALGSPAGSTGSETSSSTSSSSSSSIDNVRQEAQQMPQRQGKHGGMHRELGGASVVGGRRQLRGCGHRSAVKGAGSSSSSSSSSSDDSARQAGSLQAQGSRAGTVDPGSPHATLGGEPRSWAAQDVIAVSAMEGIGVAEAIEKYNALGSTEEPIPYTHVRTASNWIHPPVAQTHPGMWEEYGKVEEDFATGYAYAIATGSSFIMSLYQERCEHDMARGELHNDLKCQFSVSYPSYV